MKINELFKERVLILANDALCQNSANGRTLLNLLAEISSAQLAQFYIHGKPDDGVCSDFFQVSDKDALDAFLHKKKKKVPTVSQTQREDIQKTQQDNGRAPLRIVKNCRNRFLRSLVWTSYCWWTKDFEQFIREFSPTVILFQAGDAPFMFSLARKIARKYALPLIMYNSEGYVLKEVLYAGASKKSVWHALLQSNLKHEYALLMKTVNYCIYITEYLENCYQQRYPHPGKSQALYTASDMQQLPDHSQNAGFTVLYCGNLGVGRHEALDAFAKVLAQVDETAVLELYGKFASDRDKAFLCANSNVRYGGIVPYDEIPALMSRAALILHCEKNDRVVNLKHAFSTKIADSLACGRPFLVYASREYPFVQYLEENRCAHIASDETELRQVLQNCRDDLIFRNQYVDRGVAVAKQNHSVVHNGAAMRRIIEQTVREFSKA